jgi:tRNA threonylcarbamoyladenosine biosynthesis protein TsaB
VKRLIIDTATSACSVALFDGNSLIAGEHADIGRGHAERLLPIIATLPEKGRADVIHVNVGPGSFTGIRVGLAAARALAMAWKVECHGYGCLSFLAAAARFQLGRNVAVDVAITGGHGEYYFQSFDSAGEALHAAVSLSPQQAATHSTAAVITGNMADALRDLRGSGDALPLLPDARNFMAISGVESVTASPVYVRAPDAKPQPVSGTEP